MGGIGAIREEQADWLRGLDRGKVIRLDWAGVIKNRGGGITGEGGVGLEGAEAREIPQRR